MAHRTIHSAAFDQNLLTLQVPVVTNSNFLVTISQGRRSREGGGGCFKQKIDKSSQWRRYFQRGRQFGIEVQQRCQCHRLVAQLSTFQVLTWGVPLRGHFEEVQDLQPIEWQLIDNIIVVCKLIHINPATSATGENSFSTARWIKMELRSRMLQACFNHLKILNTYKDRLDKLCLVSAANSLVSLNENRERKFRQIYHCCHFSHWTCCFPLLLLYKHCSRKLTSASQLVLSP